MAIEIRFRGGPYDGKVMRDDTYRDGEHLFVEKWWLATGEGSVGSKFYLFSDTVSEEIDEKGTAADFVGHYYEVTARREVAEDIIVECSHCTATRFA